MDISQIESKSVLTRTSGYLKSVCSHSLNPYIGCGFGRSSCGVGCYVRFNPWLTRGREWGRFVDVKRNAPDVYAKTCPREKSWARGRGHPFSIFLSSSTDPWQPLETKFRITRRLLEVMQTYPPDELILQTHTALILEDLPLIHTLAGLCRLRVHLSIEGDRDCLTGLPQPPCSLEDRIRALKEFSKAGVSVVACLSPLYPLQDAHRFFSLLAQSGATAVVIDHFIQGDGTPDGSRTLKTSLAQAINKVSPQAMRLSYRDEVAQIAKSYLPVGISSQGFAGQYTQ